MSLEKSNCLIFGV